MLDRSLLALLVAASLAFTPLWGCSDGEAGGTGGPSTGSVADNGEATGSIFDGAGTRTGDTGQTVDDGTADDAGRGTSEDLTGDGTADDPDPVDDTDPADDTDPDTDPADDTDPDPDPADDTDPDPDPADDTDPADDPDPVVDPSCGYGVVTGIVCAPNSAGFINGAKVSVDTLDCDGQPLHAETTSNAQGEYLLTGVPSGVQTIHIDSSNFTTNFNVSVSPGETTDVSDLAYKWCPGALAPCTTGTVIGNICPPDTLTIWGAGHAVFVETFDCNGELVYLEAQTGPTGAFQLSGVPVGLQIVKIQVGGMVALKQAVIEPNKTTSLGATGLLDCQEPEVEDDPCVEDPASCFEPCNCIDDDGDGDIDEGCGFLWILFCHDGCNCVDDDNDGQIDEDCPDPLDCGPELCNCLDDDGDGKIDESCCSEGQIRYCDENLYCAWGTQVCTAEGAWGECKEIPVEDIPEPCQPFYGYDDEPTIYDKVCCVDAGLCCQDYPDWESIGQCGDWDPNACP